MVATLSRARTIALALACLPTSALAQVADDAADFQRRRDEIRKRFVAAARANDTAGKLAAARDMEALSLAIREREVAPAVGAGPTIASGSTETTAGSGELVREAPDDGLGPGANLRNPARPTPRPSAFLGLLASAGVHAPWLSRGSIGPEVLELQKRLAELGFPTGTPDGVFGPSTERAVRAFQRANGLAADGEVGPVTWAALASGSRGGTEERAPRTGARGTDLASLPFTSNAEALERARRSEIGRNIAVRTPVHEEEYRRASELTGVPTSLIAAIHANESAQGTYRPSTHGPESGYGLDDRSVTTAWGNEVLARHALGRWERGTDTPRGRLQSAVIAAEHMKRQARSAGIEVDSDMTSAELAGAVTSYMAGGGAGAKALRKGGSWMFDLADPNPHPRHPGGTSRVPGGRTVRVPASRKTGLLRWDTLLPLVREELR